VAVPQAKINDRLIEIRNRETILEAARRTGIDIPTLCYSEGISPEGGCRLCLVETNRSQRPVGACHTLIQPGMEIATHTPRVESLRCDILSLYLESGGQIAFQGDGRESEFTRLLARYGLPVPAPRPEDNGARIDESHTYLWFNPRLCINCRRCLNACEKIQGQFVYGMADRGPQTHLIFGPGEHFAESACVACVDRCPTLAISDRDRMLATPAERRIQRVRAAVPSPGEARPDWQAIRDTAVVMGAPWSYETPAKVMDEIARVALQLFGGVSYNRLAGDGLQWPCPAPDHPGTATMHTDGFMCGKGRLVAIDFLPNPEQGSESFPYLLVTGRVLDHYNVGTMTRRTPQRDLVPEDVLEIHPDDAAREEIGDGEVVRLESQWGSIAVKIHLSGRIAPRTLFLAFHFPETHTNRVIGPHVDPESKCPQYKATAVRLVPIQPANA